MGVQCGRSSFVLGERMARLKTLNELVKYGLEAEEILHALGNGESPQMVYNLTGSQKAAFAAQIFRMGKSGLILTYSEDQAQKWVNDLRTWLPAETVLLFPATEWFSFEVLGRSRETVAERLKVLQQLAMKQSCIIVAPVLAIEKRLSPADKWRENFLKLVCGDKYQLEDVLAKLNTGGYQRSDIADGKGQFALRGGILDIVPLTGDPVRIEFFDDEIDSLRTFDLETQKSISPSREVELAPVLEHVLTQEQTQRLRWEIQARGRRVVNRLQRSGSSAAAERLQEKLRYLDERLSQGILDENIDPYLGLIADDLVPFFEYLPDDALIMMDEPLRIKEQLDFQEKERAEEFTQQLERGEVFADPESLFLNYTSVVQAGKKRSLVVLSTLIREAPGIIPKRIINQTGRPLTGFVGKTSALVDEIEHWCESKHVVGMFAGDYEHSERLIQGLKDRGLAAAIWELDAPVAEGGVYVYPFSLDQGFELPISKLVVLTETEIYKRERKQVTRKGQTTDRDLRRPVSDLKPGDFVVHLHHGIGQFQGIEKLDVGGVAKDYFAVRYAGEDRLYVPVEQLHLLQKYLGSTAESLPKLYKLGGSEWHKVKSKTRTAVKEMAFDLVKLYAEREATKGFAFSEDSIWQKEFEEKFPYEETPDQLQSIQEVKIDMMRPRPMDRLLCGDVGYGKTEVALRAAFKAIMDSKQVAVLVPTTILAQQHYNTFRERFIGYPITIEMLSRFRSLKEQKEILKGLKDGSIDIIIGTHRLVSEGVRFKDLGLLIVDEEQRFGVAHKEKLKTLKANVDVLTLSATPIPRTLHMSLVGVRDMSVIETPPEDRYPVQTYVAEYRPDLVRDSIRREIQRGGQVFYVHNRVEDMEQVVYFLNELVPEARCGIAHGQMGEVELESVMLAFLEQELDVLVCTTIIETGLDMPNVNTLIIDESDKLGLAQLYQLRGRVGRSNRKAFAYLLYKPQKVLTEVAEKRLSAIREFTEFGSGYKIAMRDLEIRGAGNIIGAQQHGQLAAVGFDLYCQMLKEAVQELRGEKIEEKVEPNIELQVDAFIPDSYVQDRQVKSSLYQRMAVLRDEEGLREILDEFVDRFGDPPLEVENLLEIVRIKWLAARLRIEQIQQARQQIVLRFSTDLGLSGEELMKVVVEAPYPLSFSTAGNGSFECKIRLRSKEQREILRAVKTVLFMFCDVASCDAP